MAEQNQERRIESLERRLAELEARLRDQRGPAAEGVEAASGVAASGAASPVSADAESDVSWVEEVDAPDSAPVTQGLDEPDSPASPGVSGPEGIAGYVSIPLQTAGVTGAGAAGAAGVASASSAAAQVPTTNRPSTEQPTTEQPAAQQPAIAPAHSGQVPLAEHLKALRGQRSGPVVPPGGASLGGGAHDSGAAHAEVGQRRGGAGGSAAGRASGTAAGGMTGSLEALVGMKWFAVAGALGIVLGMGVLVTYAVQHNWFGALPGWLKVSAGLVLGAALVGAGEVLRKRVNPWAAVGCLCAGFGTMYVSAYAGNALVRPAVFTDTGALVLLVIISMVGAFAAARARLAIVGIVTLVGAYAAPLLLGDVDSSGVFLPVYVLVLLGMGLGLAAWVRGSFMAVGYLAWWATGVMLTWSIAAHLPGRAEAGLAFIGVAWALVHAAHVIVSRGLTVREEVGARSMWALANARSAWYRRDELRIGLSSFAATSWATVLGTHVLRESGLAPTWVAPAVLCILTLTLAQMVAGLRQALLGTAAEGRGILGASLLAQAGALLMATTAMASLGAAASVVWWALGAGALIVSLQMKSTALRTYGAALLGLGTLRLWFHDALAQRLFEGAVELGAVRLSAWNAMNLAGAVVWWVVAWSLLGPAHERRWKWATVVSLVGTMHFVLAFCHIHQSAMTNAWMLLLAVTALMLLGDWVEAARRVSLLVQGTLFAIMLCLWWGVRHVVLEDFSWSDHVQYAVLMYPGLHLALGLSAVLVYAGARWSRTMGSGPSDSRRGLLLAAGMMVWAASSLEVGRLSEMWFAGMRARGAAVSIWWAAVAVGLVAAGFVWRRAPLRHVGLVLLATAGGKVVLVDMASAHPLARAAGLLVIGLAMVGLAAVYARLSKPREV